VDTEEELDMFLKKNFTYARCSLAYDYHPQEWEMPDGDWLDKQLNFSGIIYSEIWGDASLGLHHTYKITENFHEYSEQYTMHEYLDEWYEEDPSSTWLPAYFPTDENSSNPTGVAINDEYVAHDAVVYQIN